MKKITLSLLSCFFIPGINYTQTLNSDGGVIFVSNGATLFCNGGIALNSSSQLTNNGLLTSTKNSTFTFPGDFQINSSSVVSGNGTYRIEQNWINDAVFNAGNSDVELYGNTEQFITSGNGTITSFNDLTLTGSGTNNNRRKTLLSVDSKTSANGILNLNDRELNTDGNLFTVENPSPTAIINTTVFNDEGFVSSLSNGYLIRITNQQTDYLFPVGSSDGVRRYRPVMMNPNTTTQQLFEVRFNNYSAANDGFFLTQHESAIESVNSLFYHSIEKISGTSTPEIKLFYVPATDTDWSSFAHWYPANQQWKDVLNTTQSTIPNFNFVSKNNWSFPTTNHAYALINTSDVLNIPNVFTPNGDGINDVFFITSGGLTDYNLFIVNRWGELIFESNDPTQIWDGTTNGKKCSDGVYFYTLTAKQNANDIKKQGHITINGN